VNVLISWSNERSERIAAALRDWLPMVIPAVKPWVSSHDIPKGRRWSQELAAQLKESQFAILIVLRDNQGSSWLNFEAGAISKWVEVANVAPLLFGITPSELRGPIAQFQATVFTRDDMFKLIETISKAVGVAPDSAVLRRSFDFTWETLQQRVESILNSEPQSAASAVTPPKETEPELFIFIDDERGAILEQIGTSEHNYQNLEEITNGTRMKRAKVEYLLSELTKAGYLLEEHVPMVGKCYKVIGKGIKYLMDHEVL
jgi:TIR domain